MNQADQFVCPDCGTPNPAGFRFCGGCGRPQERPCPSCGTAVSREFRFCGRCGTELLPEEDDEAAHSRAVGERKVVSVVFADLEASTELATRLDPEDLRAVYQPYFEAMAEEIERYGGTVEKFIGDAIVGVFGAPAAHEDDPVRAVQAAVAMQAKLPELNRRLAPTVGSDLALRAAVHTGEMLSTPGAEHEGLVTGETTAIAARLQGLAPTGGVVASDRTRRDARRVFDFASLGEIELRGVSEPMSAWLVVGEGPSEGATLESRLVGRQDELELLGLLLRRCEKEGRPYVVTVVGPAGIGKSRLAQEFAERIAGTPAPASEMPSLSRVVRGRCLPYGQGLHLLPLAQILKDDAGILDNDSPEVSLDKARERIGSRLGDGGSTTIDTLLSSIGVRGGRDPLSGAGREAAKRLIVDAWCRYFACLGSRPMLTLIEDIHWADDALLDLLDHLAARTAAAVLFLCLARPEVFDQRPDWGRASTNFATIELTPLSNEEEAILVQHLMDGDVSPELTASIVQRAEGNPFFAGELVRMLMENGSIERRSGAWTVVGALPSDLPDTIQGAIAARIDRLAPSEKRTLQDASVVGRLFWDGALAALGGSDATEAIDGLLGRGLIRSQQSSALAGSRELAFQHALIRDVAYGSIPRSRRAKAHKAVLGWIEAVTHGRDEEFAELLAHHAELAGDVERTARYATLAGHRHRRVFAAEEAIRWYERALSAAQDLPSNVTTLLVPEIAHSRGEALEQLGRFDEARADYEQALVIARSTGRAWLEARALAALAHILWLQERYLEGQAMLPSALEAARAAGMQDLEARLLYTAGALAWGQGDLAGAQASHQEALRVAENARDVEGEAYARHGLTETLCLLGPLEEALTQGLRTRELWRSLGLRPMEHHNSQMLGYLYVLLGRPDEGERAIEGAVSGQRELGQRREEPLALAARTMAKLLRGDLGAALTSANEGVEIGRAVGAPRTEFVALLFRMLLLSELSAGSSAEQDLSAASRLSDRIGGRFFHPPLVSARGRIELEAGHRNDAARAFADARREAGGELFYRLLCGRIEISAWEAARDATRLRDSGKWLLDSAGGSSPPHEALSLWAIALAEQMDGEIRAARQHAGAALEIAQKVSDPTVAWRASCVSATVSQAMGDAEAAAEARRRASEIVRSIASSLGDEELRGLFLARSDIAELLRAADP
ncbi:adenylate/guanylate cyclase domain-containing protein [soil metagenome]